MKIFITGIRGFLGSQLATVLQRRGHAVVGSASARGALPYIRLGESVEPSLFADTDAIVHAAHDFRPGAMQANVAGARAILEAARGRRRIFISSHSARPDAVNEYGITKYRIEKLFTHEGETIVRPGLVIGSGGMFGRQLAIMLRSRVIPLVDGGRDAVAILAISDFCAAMTAIIEDGQPSAYNLFNKWEPSMRDIVETALRLLGNRRAWLVPVPFDVALAGAFVSEKLSIPMPVHPSSLRSLRLNRNRVHASDLRELLKKEQTLEEAIFAAFEHKELGGA